MEMGDGAVIVVSDTHFGFETDSRERFENFLQWLTTSDRKVLTSSGEKVLDVPSKVILLGDILEYWAPRDDNASNAFRDSFDSFKSLFSFAPEIIYVSGNHDHVIGNYAGEYVLEDGSCLRVRPDHYPSNLSYKPEKKYKGEQIGGKKYFFLHGHQFSLFRFPALLKFGDFMAQNCEGSRSFMWLTRFGAALLLASVLVALLTNWISLLLIWLSGLLQSASLLSFPVTVVLLLWGFFVFLGVLEVFRALAFLYYEFTHHLGQIRYRSARRQPSVNVQQLVSGRYYRAERDTIDADVIVFGHTHTPEVSPAEVNGTQKLFINSGSWIRYPDRGYDTFVYIDQDGPLLLHWDDDEKSVGEIKQADSVANLAT